MWHPKGHSTVSKKGAGGGNGLVAVAIDRDKGSQNAFRWAVEHLLSKSQTVVLIHVNKPSAGANGASNSLSNSWFMPHGPIFLFKFTLVQVMVLLANPAPTNRRRISYLRNCSSPSIVFVLEKT